MYRHRNLKRYSRVLKTHCTCMCVPFQCPWHGLSVHICVCVCPCVCVYIHVYMCVSMCMCVQSCVHVCTCVCTCTCASVHVCMCMSTRLCTQRSPIPGWREGRGRCSMPRGVGTGRWSEGTSPHEGHELAEPPDWIEKACAVNNTTETLS